VSFPVSSAKEHPSSTAFRATPIPKPLERARTSRETRPGARLVIDGAEDIGQNSRCQGANSFPTTRISPLERYPAMPMLTIPMMIWG
jgi:hypothetical protein